MTTKSGGVIGADSGGEAGDPSFFYFNFISYIILINKHRICQK